MTFDVIDITTYTTALCEKKLQIQVAEDTK